MSKLIMWNLISLDGYFEGEKNWDLDFHETVWGPELEQFSLSQLRSADYLVFGRVTYQGMADYWQTAKGEIADFMNNMPKIVCSTTLDKATWNNSTLIKKDVAKEITKLKADSKKDLYVFGSANLSATLVKENLIDEFRICVAPVILGKGSHLFSQGSSQHKHSLISTQPLQTGGVILSYGS